MKRDINFFSAYQGKKQDIKEKKGDLVLYIVAGVIGALVIGSFAYNNIAKYIYERKITKIEEAMADPEFQQQLSISQQLTIKINNVSEYDNNFTLLANAVDSQDVVSTEIIDKLKSTIPSNITFTKVSINSKSVEISAQANNDRTSIAEIEHNIRQLDCVQKVFVDQITGDGVDTFNIKVNLKDVE